MRDVDPEILKEIEVLWTEDSPLPDPARRQIARTHALSVFEKTHRRGIGAAVARHLVRSSAPICHQLSETLESPALVTVVTLLTSLIAAVVFTAALIGTFMVIG